MSQNKGESIQEFGDRIFVVAEDIMGGQAEESSLSLQMTTTFTDGLRDTDIKLLLMRERPKSLDAAITLAMNESYIRQRVTSVTNDRTDKFR
jgi:hypothetical protein